MFKDVFMYSMFKTYFIFPPLRTYLFSSMFKDLIILPFKDFKDLFIFFHV